MPLPIPWCPEHEKYYTLPKDLNIIASTAVPSDSSLRFGRFAFFKEIGPSSWVGCTYPNFFSSRGFFSGFIRGFEDPAGREVYGVEVVKGYDDVSRGDDVLCGITGKVFGEVVGVCQENRVLVEMEKWFVKSDGWKLGTWRTAWRGETRLD